MSEQQTLQPVEDTIEVLIGGKPQELFMSFHRLSTITSLIPSTEAIPELLANPDMLQRLVAEAIRPSAVRIRSIEDIDRILEESQLTANESEAILTWVEAHILNFLMSRAKSSSNLVDSLAATLKQLAASTLTSNGS